MKNIAASQLDDRPGSGLQAALLRDLGLRADASHLSLFREAKLLGSFDHNLMQHITAIGRSFGKEREEAESLTRMRMMSRRVRFAVFGRTGNHRAHVYLGNRKHVLEGTFRDHDLNPGLLPLVSLYVP